jgi:hypothetical protein
MKLEDLHTATNPDLATSLVAIHRAAALARDVAIQTGTAIIVVQAGQRVRITADELRRERVGQ